MPDSPQTEKRSVLSLDTFKFERAVFEVRYPLALLLWDRSGQLWTDAMEKWPGLVLVMAQPDKTVFKAEPSLEMTTEIGAARFIQHWPKLPLKEFAESSKSFFDLVTGHLEIRTLSRVGLRLIFFREFPDRDSAGAAVLETGLLAPLEGRYFGGGEAPVSADCSFVWETKAVGIRAVVAYQKRQYKLERPLGLPDIEPTEFLHHGVIFDIDFYTTSAIDVGQLGVGEWIDQHVRALKRDGDAFLAGVRG